MKKLSSLLFLLIYINYTCFSQEKADSQNQIFTIVEEQAEFPGGVAELGKFIQKNLQYPTIARDLAINDKCVVMFVVNETDVQPEAFPNRLYGVTVT